MKDSWKRFKKLSKKEKLLAFKALKELSTIYLLLKIYSFQNFKSKYGQVKKKSNLTKEDWSKAISRASQIAPAHFTCLVQALVFKKAFSSEKELKLVIGIKENAHVKLDAHAWVEDHQQIYIGDRSNENYLPLYTWQ